MFGDWEKTIAKGVFLGYLLIQGAKFVAYLTLFIVLQVLGLAGKAVVS